MFTSVRNLLSKVNFIYKNKKGKKIDKAVVKLKTVILFGKMGLSELSVHSISFLYWIS